MHCELNSIDIPQNEMIAVETIEQYIGHMEQDDIITLANGNLNLFY